MCEEARLQLVVALANFLQALRYLSYLADESFVVERAAQNPVKLRRSSTDNGQFRDRISLA
jgi:hypothetical protein